MFLDTVNRRLQVRLLAATAGTQSSVICSWIDVLAHDVVPGTTVVATNSTTPVDVVAPPAASVYRLVKEITVHNLDTVTTTYIFTYKDGGTVTEFQRVQLLPLQTATYDGKGGWSVAPTASGTLARRITTITSSATPAINTDSTDIFAIGAQAADISSMTSGLAGATPTPGQELQVEITDDGNARSINWGASFEDSYPFSLPTKTVPGVKILTLLRWNFTTAKWKCIWTSGGLSSSIANQLVWDGDSHTSGADLSVPFPTLVTPLDASYTATNTGVGGSTVPQMGARAYGSVDSLFKPEAGKNLVMVQGGGNDMGGGATAATTFLNLVSYCLARRRRGWKVCIGTMYSRIGLDTQKNALNALIRANWPSFADGLIDYAAIPQLGADNAYSNATYFQSTGPSVGVHLKDAGATLAASLGASAIANIWLGPGRIKRAEFRADKNGTAQAGIVTATYTKVTFGNVFYNQGAYYDATNSKWTPPYGLMRMWATVLFSGGVVDQSIYAVDIFKNGASVAEGIMKASGSDLCAVTVNWEDIPGGTDYYEVFAYGAGAGNKTITGTVTQTLWYGEVM